MTINKQLGARIRYLRQQKNMTIEDLALEAEINRNYLCDLERETACVCDFVDISVSVVTCGLVRVLCVVLLLWCCFVCDVVIYLDTIYSLSKLV